MKAEAFPPEEAQRQEVLRAYAILDTPPEAAFDELTALAAHVCGTPSAFISLLDGPREWRKATLGVAAREVARDGSFCTLIVQQREILVIPDTSRDPRFADHPLVTGDPSVRFYAGIPLISPEGLAFGALAVVDSVPRELSGQQRESLELLSRQVLRQLEMRRKLNDFHAVEAGRSALMESALDAIIMMDHHGVILEFNAAAEKMFGVMRGRAVGKSVAETIIPEDLRAGHRAGLERYLASGSGAMIDGRVEIVAQRADGTRFPAELSVSRCGKSNPPVFVGFLRDITDRKRAEAALRTSERKLRAIFDAEPECVKLLEPDGVLREINQAGLQIIEADTLESVIGKPLLGVVVAEDLPAVRAALDDVVRGESRTLEFRITGFRGSLRWMEMTAVPLPDDASGHNLILGVSRDVTERRRAQELLRENAFRLRHILDSMFAFVGVFSLDGRIIEMNAAPLKATGLRREDVIGQPFTETFWWSHSTRGQQQLTEALARVAQGETVRSDFEVRIGHAHVLIMDGTFSPLYDANGQVSQIVGSAVDVTEVRRSREALRESETRFRQLMENIREVFWMVDTKTGQILYVSPTYEQLWGKSEASLFQDSASWLECVHPDDRARIVFASENKITVGHYDEEYRIIRADGSIRWIHDRAFPVKDAKGEVYRAAGVAVDITEQKRLEEQLRQSQKMEAIGQLASGVAHDFNNLLTVIQGNASLLLLEGEDGPPDDCAQQIAQAAERAATLTRQLLFFGRKQVMQPVNLDLNEAVGNMTKMLQRILGDDIALNAEFAPNLPLVHADAGMLEQVLLNFAVNSRDAMPHGGRLLISTRSESVGVTDALRHPDATPGRYVCLSVLDTGSGIPPEVLPRIFDPFFTTKEVGKGTGLGLATVYGIVRQHRGWLSVESELGQGSTFHVHLPASEHTRLDDSRPERGKTLPLGHETILVVEDEPSVRLLAQHLLQRCGFNVIQAVSGVGALQVWKEQKDNIDLVLTDMVMPDGVSGYQLAEMLRAERPNLKVIYTSGYSAEIVGKGVTLVEGVNFLQKPYPPQKLARTVRDFLDNH